MSYTVTLKASGKTFQAKPSQTILEAASDAGITIPYGCRSGMCGSCKGQLLSGNVMLEDYQKSALTEQEKSDGLILCCKALATESITIDIRESEEEEIIKSKITPVRVESLENLNKDVIKMMLKLPGDEKLQFKAGQYIEFIMADNSRRAFSLANPPHQGLLELHLRLIEGGKFTQFVFNEMKEKSIHRIEAPIGQFYLRESEKPIVFVAGGTGFAPIKSVIEDLIFNNIKRPIFLYRGAGSFEDLYMHDLAKNWANKINEFSYIPVSEKIPKNNDQLRIGLVHHAVLEDFKSLANVQVYCCGAPGLVQTAFESFTKKGLPEDEFYADAFTFAPPKNN
ncbi:CDP-6-deoxy-delta-3,4-glucoseen reductase [Methylophilaceae bacterium]|jgi:CDP-4-dehydro-6-deoxyglucose reductase, E3|nr:CDP-6-deoxy-delta-3,4-glucoseen reductase [Methylophilaceae bacterium]|tara:strand:+ start:100 stop:1113 length:1014 start_codon:yes stop_codon:yes gene_type:complete